MVLEVQAIFASMTITEACQMPLSPDSVCILHCAVRVAFFVRDSQTRQNFTLTPVFVGVSFQSSFISEDC